MSLARSSAFHTGAENLNLLRVNPSDTQPFPLRHTAHAGVNLRVDYGKHYHVEQLHTNPGAEMSHEALHMHQNCVCVGGVWFYLISSV